MIGEATFFDLAVPSIRRNGEYHFHYCPAGDHQWKHWSGRHCERPWSADCDDPQHGKPE